MTYTKTDQIVCFMMRKHQGEEMVSYLTGIPIDVVRELVEKEIDSRRVARSQATRESSDTLPWITGP